MTRVTVPADNNCLFSVVGYLMYEPHEKRHAGALRRLAAEAVRSDPAEFNEAVLEKPPAEYVAWILDERHWGGAVELTVLARHFECELAAIEVRTQQVYVFGEDRGYARRAYLIWDGIHYDALARDPGHGDPADFQTVFAKDDADAREGSLQEVRALHDARQFTDTANFTLMCLEDNVPLRGQQEAIEHARRTGHTNFAEYDPDRFR